ncbi:MAG: DUF4912 domain-containing protein [Candidatus Sumerlaeia bacterium]|nr:DUF4912 domain-containing protein [Candidatus Sumerlaeia bacterium]
MSDKAKELKPATESQPKAAKKVAAPKKAAAPTKVAAPKKAAEPKAVAAKKAAKKVASPKPAAEIPAVETKPARKPAAKKATKKVATAKVIDVTPASVAVAEPAASKPAAAKSAEAPIVAKTATRHTMDRIETGATGRISTPARRAPGGGPVNGAILYRQAKATGQAVGAKPARDAAAGTVEIPELPESYGETRLSVLIRDAEWVFVYWEIAEATRQAMGLTAPSVPLKLRLYDVTGLGADRSRAHSRVDIPVTDYTNSWYVHIGSPGREYLIELGAVGDGGVFRAIVRSSVFSMPAHRLSDDFEWTWGPQEEEAHLQLLRMSGGVTVSSHLSSVDFVKELQARLAEQTSSWGGFSGELVGSEFMVRALSKHDLKSARERGFWLVVDTEVIVYGATEPDARVRFMGRDIRLNADGTFGIRMALPNGTLEFPIEASSADGEETRSVMPVVSRRTI